ncbi:CHAD domain-containing protein [Afipia sp. GAS231]|uniref:CHAD domain-containing protein n=1 Tax=Afipia sp. GAS231 TaxID=1882747 RepID=UPI00087ACBE3|nr:CHAD domain-containing protein [Afipia sp. GAS231]SDO56053.1 CHAD domain-containing protein [Afipia sp. GAS231]
MTQADKAKASGRRKAVAVARPDCATVFQKIAQDCVASIKAHHGSACAGDAEAVHLIRVAITRLRATVSFFAPIAADAEWLRLKQEIAWLNVSLGAARDSDVMVEYARRRRYRAWAGRVIGADLDRRRTQDHRRLVRCLRSARARRLIDALAVWTRQGPWLARWEAAARRGDAEPLQAYCGRELNRWRERLIRKGKDLASLNTARRHHLRIRAKRFRYMLEALTDIVAMRSRAELRHMHRAAKRLQRTLGDLRDLRRFARLSPSADKRAKRPPGYRRQREKLGNAAAGAWRDLKQAGAC